MGFARMSASSFKNFPKNAPSPTPLELLILIIFKTFPSKIWLRQKWFEIVKLE